MAVPAQRKGKTRKGSSFRAKKNLSPKNDKADANYKAYINQFQYTRMTSPRSPNNVSNQWDAAPPFSSGDGFSIRATTEKHGIFSKRNSRPLNINVDIDSRSGGDNTSNGPVPLHEYFEKKRYTDGMNSKIELMRRKLQRKE